MDPKAHKRYLDYRETFTYFARGENKKLLTMEEFAAAEIELRALDAKANRDDDEEARFAELMTLLFRD